MSYIAPALLLISLVMACFTDPQGVLGIWISSEQVVSVLHPTDCTPEAHTKIVTQSGSFCVLETPQEVLQRLQKSK